MRKKILVTSLVFSAFLFGAYFLLLDEKGGKDDQLNTSTSPAKLASDLKEEGGFSGAGAIEDILTRGDSAECKIWYEITEGEEGEGTVFVSNNMLRGDFVTDSPDLSGEILTSFVFADQSMFYWSEIEGEKYGARMSLEDSEGGEALPVSMNDTVRYECSYWLNVDDSVFAAPSDVLWTDLDELENSSMEYGTVYEEGEF